MTTFFTRWSAGWALDIAPKNAVGEADAEDTIINALRRRTGTFVAGIE